MMPTWLPAFGVRGVAAAALAAGLLAAAGAAHAQYDSRNDPEGIRSGGAPSGHYYGWVKVPRAMYLGSTLYRIHGSNDAESIGEAESSGCFRLTNEDAIDLYKRVKIGTVVHILR
jgi:lipoprotein-anchoring transpeptidase ErfK/SrfK